jgi:regulator of RNase E activity RraB
MGLQDIFKNNNRGQFVTEKEFKNNVAKQVELTPLTLNQLRNYRVTDDNELKVEFFFYSRTQERAERLTEELKKINYEAEFRESAGKGKLFVITGWTNKMKMDGQTIKSWAKQMCELGYELDCDFDGWGTTPEQD